MNNNNSTADISSELRWRGLVHQTTDNDHIGQWLLERPRVLYAGFDPTSNSLHVGNFMSLMMLRRFQKAGHRPIALLGGATGMIGDPSGKNEERNLLDTDTLERNVSQVEEQLRRFLDFESGSKSAILVNNYDWMRDFGYIPFLRDVGKNFPVNVMLAKDSVKNRLGRDDGGISYTEFSYMLLQAYDFVYLNGEFGCELQVGGSDQWGNITAGIDLARRMRGVQLYGITCPLLLKSDGTKMGKTEEGALWLSAEKTSPYLFYQYWINLQDNDAGKCLRFLTELPRDEIESLDAQRESRPEKRDSQRRLAESLTELVHGSEGLAAAKRATEIFFGSEIHGLSDSQLGQIFADVPSCDLRRSSLEGHGMSTVDALVSSGLCKSKGDARRTIAQGGAYINNRRVDSSESTLKIDDLASETIMVVRTGKKKYALLRFRN